MLIKISKGEVHLKDRLGVADFYEFNCIESSALKIKVDGDGPILDGESVQKAKMEKVLLSIEKITIDGNEVPVSKESLLSDDYFTVDDFQCVFEPALDHINDLAKKAKTKKKS